VKTGLDQAEPVLAKQQAEPATDAGLAGEAENEPQKTDLPQGTGERVLKKSVRVDAHKIDMLMNQVGGTNRRSFLFFFSCLTR
jgi:chemotaxis protein histidine kinase CheA